METRQRIHLAGVGGVGMSALAELLLALGWEVTGSDRAWDRGEPVETIETLQRAGLRMFRQDGSGLREGARALVVSTAIEEGNLDLDAARRAGVEVVHRAEMLARLAAGTRLVAISGTAGKTTVTGLVGWLLERAGFDPTVVNGGVVLNWRGASRLGSARLGRSPWWVIETDESDRSLLRFEPSCALITNISKDHFELEEVCSLFREFAGRVRGELVVGPGVASVLRRPAVEPRFELDYGGGRWVIRMEGEEYQSPLIGRHNAENTALAIALCRALGVPADVLRGATPLFRGVHRRLEQVGFFRGARIIDDYAHNPAKIAASWRAVAELGGRVLGWWRPHGFGPLALMFDELVETLSSVVRAGDRLFVLPVYYAGGTARRAVEAGDLVAAVRARGAACEEVSDYNDLRSRLEGEARPGDVLLGMGARDLELPRFARALASSG